MPDEVPEPRSEAAQDLRRRVRAERWKAIVEKAQHQAIVVREVRELSGCGLSIVQGLGPVSPKTPRATSQYWSARVEADGSASWEDLLDRRIPPAPKKIPEVVRESAKTLRTVDQNIQYEEARRDLVTQLGGVAYMAATLDKFLAQLAFLDVADALWGVHSRFCRRLATRWSSRRGCPAWLRMIIYIDATQEPYWTREYAKSGKTSRTGRVAPCLTRVAVTAGPGVPFLMETYAGTRSPKTELPHVLVRVDAAIGEGELGRLTMIDAGMATGHLFHALVYAPNKRRFITVLTGKNILTDFVPSSEWVPYREHDEIRDGSVVVYGRGLRKSGLKLRAVEMCHTGRHTHSTFFGTNLPPAMMEPSQVADAYLSRWPHQKQVFRNTLPVTVRTSKAEILYLAWRRASRRVTVRTSKAEILYQVAGNPRNPTRNEQMRKVCEESARRQIKRNGRTLRFELVEPDEDG